MDWYQDFMIGCGIFAAIAFPVLLGKAIRRKERHRIFDIIVGAACLAYLVLAALRPSEIHGLNPAERWLLTGIFLLWLANSLGFSRWLFRASAAPAREDSGARS